MWGDAVVNDVAAMLGVTELQPLTGGEFGAYRGVVDDGSDVVLKTWPYPQFGSVWQRGATIANRLRARGYPAPAYRGAGATERACWSLQDFLDGDVPSTLTEPLAIQMIDCAREHTDAAHNDHDFGAETRAGLAEAVETLRTNEATIGLADEFDKIRRATMNEQVRDADVVHSDFHPGNVLAQGDELVGVFDWEGARPGDWRCDLANLVVTSDSTAAVDALTEQPTALAALFVSWHCARYLAFDITNHPPGTVERMAPDVEHRLAHWWR